MREQVGRRAVAALVEPEAPREHAERVGAVHREEAPAVVRQRAQLAGRDQLGGVAHERRPAVVEPDAADHAGPAHRALGAHGLLGRAADRLLAEHVLARLRGRLDQLDVEHVRRRDRPRRRPPGPRPPGASRRSRARSRTRTTASSATPGAGSAQVDQHRVVRALAEQHREPGERARVRAAQPPEPDHPDADPPPAGCERRHPRAGRGLRAHAHVASSWRSSSCVSWSSSAPPDIFLTSSSRLISPRRQSPISLPRLRITKRSPTG